MMVVGKILNKVIPHCGNKGTTVANIKYPRNLRKSIQGSEVLPTTYSSYQTIKTLNVVASVRCFGLNIYQF